MKKFLKKLEPFLPPFVIISIIIVSICYEANPKFMENSVFLKWLLMFSFGLICLGSGLLGWKSWGIRSGIRESKYGEILNTIVMTFVGITAVVLSFGVW